MHNQDSLNLSDSLSLRLLFVILSLDIVFALFALDVFSPFVVATYLMISVLVKLVIHYFQIKKSGSRFNFSNVFLVFFIFFSLGGVPILFFGIDKPMPFKVDLNARYLSNLYANVFLSGYIFFALIATRLAGVVNPRKSNHWQPPSISYLAPCILAVAGFFCLTFFYSIKDVIKRSLDSGYMAIYSSDSSASIGSLVTITAAFAIPLLIVFFILNGPRFNMKAVIGFTLFGFVAVSSFLTGVRSIALFSVLGLVYAYRHLFMHKSIRYSAFAAFFGSVFLLVPFSSYWRERSSDNSSVGPSISEYFFAGHWSPLTVLKETSFTSEVFAKVIEVSASGNLLLGESYLRSVYNLLPQRIANILFTTPPDFLANWFVRNVDPGWYEVGGGFAFNFIAEAYLNFGFPGIILMSFLLGFNFTLLSAMNNESSSSSWRRILEALFIVNLTIWVRSETMAIIRPVFWYSLLPTICVCLFETLTVLKFHSRWSVDRSSRNFVAK